jgi:hypothetical protein
MPNLNDLKMFWKDSYIYALLLSAELAAESDSSRVCFDLIRLPVVVMSTIAYKTRYVS